MPAPHEVYLPVGIGDQRQASIVPRHLPQDGEDEEQHLHEAEGNRQLPIRVGTGKLQELDEVTKLTGEFLQSVQKTIICFITQCTLYTNLSHVAAALATLQLP